MERERAAVEWCEVRAAVEQAVGGGRWGVHRAGRAGAGEEGAGRKGGEVSRRSSLVNLHVVLSLQRFAAASMLALSSPHLH